MLRNFVFITRFGCVTAQAVLRIRLQDSQFGICGGKNVFSHRSLNAIVTQSKNCPFGVNTAIDLKNTKTTSDDSGI
jgi:hypothetical protein